MLDGNRPGCRGLGMIRNNSNNSNRSNRAGSLRKTAAVLAGKATGALSRITRRGGGTTLPGDVARAIDPRVLTKLAGDLTHGSIVITGTNGKTTTARLISYLLEGAGNKVVSNRAFQQVADESCGGGLAVGAG